MSLIWDAPKALFTFPATGHEVRIYGVLFALGAWFAWLLIRKNFISLFLEKGEQLNKAKERSTKLLDKLTWISVLSLVVGARLFHLLFYDFDYFINDPLSLFRIWEPGLASHGGTIGLLAGVALFWKTYQDQFLGASFLQFLDRFAPPTAITAAFIRFGNLFNQEILGTPTDMPWGVTFLHPVDGGPIVPRHPVQLYEGLFYLACFFILRKMVSKTPGFVSGLFFVLIFGGRIVLEIFKDSQEGVFDGAFLSTGQLLSVPLVLLGIFLMFRKSFWPTKRPANHAEL